MERLTLEEAICRVRGVAKKQRWNSKYTKVSLMNEELNKRHKADCIKDAEEHEQLAEWLEELKEVRESENDNIFYQIRKKLKEDKIPENMEPFIKEQHYRSTENETVLEVKIGWRER